MSQLSKQVLEKDSCIKTASYRVELNFWNDDDDDNVEDDIGCGVILSDSVY